MNDFLIYSVEDDHEISNLIRIALEKSDFEVRCFDDGESFLKTFEIKKPNLILLDLMLPGIQGDEILKTIRKDIGNDKIPIVILSAKSLLEDRITGLNNGADDYIVKPFNIKELISYYGEKLALPLSRKYVCWYCKNLRDARKFREHYVRIDNFAAAFQAIEDYFNACEMLKGEDK